MPARTTRFTFARGGDCASPLALRGISGPDRWRPADDIAGEHRPPAEQRRLPFALVVHWPKAVTRCHDGVTPAGILRESGPPALPVLLVPIGPLALDLG